MEQSYEKFKNIHKYKWIFTLIGSMLIHLALGNLYSIINIAPYIASYMRVVHNLDVYASSFASGIAGMIQMMTPGIMIACFLINYISEKWVLYLASFIFGLSSYISTFFMYDYDIFLTLQCYIVGLAEGMAYALPLKITGEWRPEKKGLSTGLILSCFSLASVIFNLLQYFIINPNNLSPVELPGLENFKFFTDSQLFDNTIHYLKIIAFVHLAMTTLGATFITIPNKKDLIAIQLHAEASSSRDSPQEKEKKKESLRDEELMNYKDCVSLKYNKISPWNIIKVKSMYKLVLLYGINSFMILYVSTMSKTGYGANKHSDAVLTTVSTIGAIFGAAGRIFFGALTDYIQPYKVLLGVFGTWLLAVIIHLSLGNSDTVIFFAASVCLNFFCLGGFMSTGSCIQMDAVGTVNFQIATCFLQITQFFILPISSRFLQLFYIKYNDRYTILLFFVALLIFGILIVINWGESISRPILVPSSFIVKGQEVIPLKVPNGVCISSSEDHENTDEHSDEHTNTKL